MSLLARTLHDLCASCIAGVVPSLRQSVLCAQGKADQEQYRLLQGPYILCAVAAAVVCCSEESQVLLARLMSGYGRDVSLNAKERKAPGTASITQLPGSPSASRSSNFGSEAVDGKQGSCASSTPWQQWCRQIACHAPYTSARLHNISSTAQTSMSHSSCMGR